MTVAKTAYKHGYSGSCGPGNMHTACKTFSVGCFQWLPKSRGNDLKKSAVRFRVKGKVSDAKRVYAEAEEFCSMLDDGWLPDKRSITV